MIKKIIAPIVITVIVMLYYLGIGYIAIKAVDLPLWIKIIGLVVPLIIAGLAIYNLIERIKEIKSGEEDDLSQY
jgi:hypothetical protein